jgi:hypothetical protein
MFVTLGGSLALLTRLLTATLLLTGLLSRRLILLARLILVRHGFSFHGNTGPTARSSGSFLTKKKYGPPCRNYVSLTYSGLRFPINALSRRRRAAWHRDCSGVTPRGNVSSSEIIIRTHNHRPTNKREPVFRSNH